MTKSQKFGSEMGNPPKSHGSSVHLHAQQLAIIPSLRKIPSHGM
jgi:hypothetical protein